MLDRARRGNEPAKQQRVRASPHHVRPVGVAHREPGGPRSGRHPCVGAAVWIGDYGGVRATVPAHLSMLKAIDRPLLHAARLSFDHPADGRRVSFEAPIPPDISSVLLALRHTPDTLSHAR